MLLSLAGGALTVVFYVGLSTALQLVWYGGGDAAGALSWKTQPARRTFVESAGVWWLPARDVLGRGKVGRHPRHALFATINVLLAGACTAVSFELVARGYSRVLWDWADATPLGLIASVVGAVAWENVVEYYYHRMMHTRLLYGLLHKYHHFYKSPEPFDDMMVHPLEVFGYYTLSLFTPPFVVPMHWLAVLVYAVIMGITGILDHCGIRMRFPGGLYDTRHHDLHHELTNVNFGFPFTFMDLLHGTDRAPK